MENRKKTMQRIGKTPLSISIYTVEDAPTQLHEEGILEIIFCLKGSVRFSYAYEEFKLHAGEYISVDKDAYYLYDGRDNLCVSFYIDLLHYEQKYPFIRSSLFVCEALEETTMDYPTREHNQLKGMLISMLKYIGKSIGEHVGNEVFFAPDVESKVEEITGRIVDLFINNFDISFYYASMPDIDQEDLERLHQISFYMHTHMKEKITMGNLAKELNLTEGYLSEYIRSKSIGFRNMLGYIRANESEKYLLETEKTIIEISEECGFSDVKYYYSAFKRWYRCTPHQFRQRYGKPSREKIDYLEFEHIKEILEEILVKHYMEIFFENEGNH